MRTFIIFFFLFPIILFADGPMGENVHGRYGPEEMFTEKGQEAIPVKGFDRNKCFKENLKFRIFINRTRTISFRIERKCNKGAGSVHLEECSQHIRYLDEVYQLLNRQIQVLNNVCLP